VAIVDYGLGNLFSIKHACTHVGLDAIVTFSADDLFDCSAIILPGVGAFGDAVDALNKMDLAAPIRDVAASGKPLLGVCLGFQLLMERSDEFGRHVGLGLVPGEVKRLEPESSERVWKVPHVGWSRLSIRSKPAQNGSSYRPLDSIEDGSFMYFVHSFCVRPEHSDLVVCTSEYGGETFCSALQVENVFGCQFHPERSGPAGLMVYANLARTLKEQNHVNV